MTCEFDEQETTMSFSRENEVWVRNEIQTAIDHAVSPPNRLMRKAKDAGLITVLFTVPLALIALCVTLGIALSIHRDTEATFRGTTQEKLSGIERQLIDLRALVASSQPTRTQNQNAAKQLLSEATQKAIPPIPAPVVEESGKSFIGASSTDPQAWPVALQFVNYRSTLNAPEKPNFGTGLVPLDISKSVVYSLGFVPGKPKPNIYSYGNEPLQSAAKYELLGSPIKQPGADGNKWVLLSDGALAIDGHWLRHIVIENAEVHYDGGPVLVDDVLFINCSFVVSDNDNGRGFANAVISSPRVNFKT